jgi:hypothetical protein
MRALAIHGHFYQPPREDPLTGVIPSEFGAAPFANWNERIHAECYRPNADLGNFERISFNVGPTLARWMEDYDAPAYRKIVAQDDANVRRFGVGNAIAQAYNHTILPLASRADKVTQVAWGIADFAHRFGRKPQGLWLPETAVNTETLEVMADAGIEFTILAPWQAASEHIDTTEPYRVALPHGKSIAVFFYDRDLSGRVSFDPALTSNADAFALHDLQHHYNHAKAQRGEPQLVLVASDGELYGHHQPFRDYFLARLLSGASELSGLTPTFPARWLRDYPPRRTVGIRDNTSWSCHHGVMRWAADCSCAPGEHGWKARLRAGLDHVASALDELYTAEIRRYVPDPLALRNRYIHVMLGELRADELIGEAAGRRLPSAVLQRIQLLLESQRERQRMFTSCGWFFEDFDRIEPKNNVAYAAHAVVLARRATGVDLAPVALDALRDARSWRTGLSAGQVFEHYLGRSSIYQGVPMPRADQQSFQFI